MLLPAACLVTTHTSTWALLGTTNRLAVIYLVAATTLCYLPTIFERLIENGQVVFTLTDVASAELQQRVDHSTDAIIQENLSTFVKNASEHAPIVVVHSSKREIEETYKTEAVLVEQVDQLEVVSSSIEKFEDVKENVQIESEVVTEAVLEPQKVNITETIAEEIPSFSEWSQKQLEEVEKKEKINSSIQSHYTKNKSTSNLKLRSKNYASPDCGAKIVAANPDATSPGAVLSSLRDEYQLSACTSKIWFVVELCEAIQAKKIELANFELFSSSPKEFVVSVSDRYPSREWSNVGQFTAEDKRDVQSFNLYPHLFVKFIKLEMLSHYGSEHFCPISLFRVYGTSELEVLENDALDVDVDTDEDGYENTEDEDLEVPTNLFGSARDAVFSLVKKAAQALVKSSTNRTQDEIAVNVPRFAAVKSCTTPSHIVVCDNCSDVLFSDVYEFLSCETEYLWSLLKISLVSKTLYNTDICLKYGLNFTSKRTATVPPLFSNYISAFFGTKHVASLCNLLAVIENQVVLNTSNDDPNSTVNSTDIETETIAKLETVTDSYQPPYSVTSSPMISIEAPQVISSSVIDTSIHNEEEVGTQISPTKTLRNEAVNDTSKVQISSEAEQISEPVSKVSSSSVVQYSSAAASSPRPAYTEQVEGSKEFNSAEDGTSHDKSAEPFDMSQVNFYLSDLNLESDQTSSTSSTTAATPTSGQQQLNQKESVFLRLSNRIKALERNMSLSTQYLEELSRRYKKQMEDMHRAFNRTLQAINEEGKIRKEELTQLTEQLNALLSERNSERDSKIFWIGQVVLIQMCITFAFIYFIWKRTPHAAVAKDKTKKQVKKNEEFQRRQSIDVVRHEVPNKAKRRPSEEALNIVGTYNDLMVPEDGSRVLSKAERKWRRRQNILHRSSSNSNVSQNENKPDQQTRRASSTEIDQLPDKSLLKQELDPVCSSGNWGNNPMHIENDFAIALEDDEPIALFEPVLYENQVRCDVTDMERLKSLNPVRNGSSKFTKYKKLSSPLFMHTALSSRQKRISLNGKIPITNVNSSQNSHSQHLNGLSGSSSDGLDEKLTPRVEKKSSLKKIFKKVF